MDAAQIAQVVLFSGSHVRLVLGAFDMVVLTEVEDTVHKKVGKLGIEGVAEIPGLPLGRRKGDGNITKEWSFRNALNEVARFVWKRKYVSGFVDAKELPVHLADLVIVRDQDREGGPCGDPFAGHHTLSQVPES